MNNDCYFSENSKNIFAGFMSGITSAILFNPFDKALFLRQYHNRNLWNKENFKHPFQGFGNASTYKTLSAGSYLYFQETNRTILLRNFPVLENHNFMLQAMIGLFSGAQNGILLNQLQIVKHRAWLNKTSVTSSVVAKQMYIDGGIRVFFRGSGIFVLRNSVFGFAYEVTRKSKYTRNNNEHIQFFVNAFAAFFASLLAAPLNYSKNMIYSVPLNNSPLKTKTYIKYLIKETCTKNTTIVSRIMYMNGRLNVGWGSVRVGIGLAFGQLFSTKYKELAKYLDS